MTTKSYALTPPAFTLSSLWKQPILNPVNLKSYTLPIFNLSNPYSRNFHLSWLGFFVAFLSWFAFPPLIPSAIRTDLHLTAAQVSYSNITALCATFLVRFLVGPLVDRYGPRKVMASLLVLGAIPSGLAGTAKDAGTLYTLRFFIGILGGTFVPCQAWTTAFFDKNVVGVANALVGGWGNMGGGITFVIMIALYNNLLADHLTPHVAWRAAFAIVPVPILLFTAALVMIFGTDHPAGKWSMRHNVPATSIAVAHGHMVKVDEDEEKAEREKRERKVAEGDVAVKPVEEDDEANLEKNVTSELDVAVNESLTFGSAGRILSSPLTWLPALAYFTTFGFELSIDGNFANVLFALFSTQPGFGQTKAGYLTALFGLLNLFTRPLGGYFADRLYRPLGVPGKKYLTLTLGFLQGVLSLALGLYISQSGRSLGTIMGLLVVTALFNEAGNGANFALVPHCNPYSNGLMSGIVGSMGNLGGVFMNLVYLYQPVPVGKAMWITGVLAMAVNVLLVVIPVPKR